MDANRVVKAAAGLLGASALLTGPVNWASATPLSRHRTVAGSSDSRLFPVQ
jgi:hypothetical protein